MKYCCNTEEPEFREVSKIAIIGQQCSGKTTAANFIKQEFTVSETVKVADPLYCILSCLKQDKNRLFMQEVADLAKKHFGELILVDILKEKIKSLETSYCCRGIYTGDVRILIICDDIRRQYEFDMMKELGFSFISIDASREIRKARAERLGLAFIEDHNSETEVPSLIDQADFIIKDDGISQDKLKRHCYYYLRAIQADAP